MTLSHEIFPSLNLSGAVGENKYESPHMKQTQAIIKTRVHSEEVEEKVDIEHVVVAADMFYGTEHPRSYGKVPTALLE